MQAGSDTGTLRMREVPPKVREPEAEKAGGARWSWVLRTVTSSSSSWAFVVSLRCRRTSLARRGWPGLLLSGLRRQSSCSSRLGCRHLREHGSLLGRAARWEGLREPDNSCCLAALPGTGHTRASAWGSREQGGMCPKARLAQLEPPWGGQGGCSAHTQGRREAVSRCAQALQMLSHLLERTASTEPVLRCSEKPAPLR